MLITNNVILKNRGRDLLFNLIDELNRLNNINIDINIINEDINNINNMLLLMTRELVKQNIEISKLKNDMKFLSGCTPKPTQCQPKKRTEIPPHKIPIEDRCGNRLDVCHWLRTGEKRWGYQNKG